MVHLLEIQYDALLDFFDNGTGLYLVKSLQLDCLSVYFIFKIL